MNQTQDHDGQQCAALRWLESDIPIEPVPVALLQRGESPRLKGESKAHIVRLLAATGIPPIIVHRSTMGIIDGRARVAPLALQMMVQPAAPAPTAKRSSTSTANHRPDQGGLPRAQRGKPPFSCEPRLRAL